MKDNDHSSDNLYVTSNKSIEDYFKEKSLKKAEQEKTSTKRNIDQSEKEENPYLGSNLCELQGYDGWTIPMSFDQILKKKKKRKRT